MKKAVLLLAVFSLVALAASPVASTVTTTAALSGAQPSSLTAGVKLQGATSIRVRVSSPTGTLTGGKVCAFYLPSGSTLVSQWVRSPGLDLTLPSSATELDAGIVRSVVLPDLAVIGQYGRVSYVACGLTGTANDGGTIDTSITTETWGPSYP